MLTIFVYSLLPFCQFVILLKRLTVAHFKQASLKPNYRPKAMDKSGVKWLCENLLVQQPAGKPTQQKALKIELTGFNPLER